MAKRTRYINGNMNVRVAGVFVNMMNLVIQLGEPLTFSAAGKEEVIRMTKKPQYKESKEQKEKQVLFDHMEKEISKVKEYLKTLYSMAGSPNVGLLVSEEFIHRRVAALDRVKGLIWDLLVDEMAPKKILDELKNNKVSLNP